MDEQSTHLPCGTVLHGAHCDYTVQRVLGQGTFGITYCASVRLKGALGAYTQPCRDEVVPIGQGFYAVRNGSGWGIVTVENPFENLLGGECDNISRLGIHVLPGPGPFSFRDAIFGVRAHRHGATAYYECTGDKFVVTEVFTDEEMRERETFT